MPAVKRIRFTETISAPVGAVFELMLAPDSYRKWASAFAEGCHYEGSWEQGRKIRFLGPSGDGMVAEIAEHRPNEFTSIRHLGFVMNGVEDTESEAVRGWMPAHENYTFQSAPGGTALVVELDVTEEFEADMIDAWPRALKELKAICEAS